jgi:hypothetical protein
VARIDQGNAAELIAGADLVLDGCDNFATRLAVSDACVAAGIPLTSAALGRFQGQVATSPAIAKGIPATAASWAMPSMPRTAIPAPIWACWARWWA